MYQSHGHQSPFSSSRLFFSRDRSPSMHGTFDSVTVHFTIHPPASWSDREVRRLAHRSELLFLVENAIILFQTLHTEGLGWNILDAEQYSCHQGHVPGWVLSRLRCRFNRHHLGGYYHHMTLVDHLERSEPFRAWDRRRRGLIYIDVY